MRHYKKGRKLGTSKAHTKAMKRSLVTALFENDRIKTIEARAKEIRPDVDKIITWAKKGDLHSRRLAIAALGGNKELVREIFEKVEKGMFKDRKGGYTRIMKLGYRKGDNAPIVIMELVTERASKKKSASGAGKASSGAGAGAGKAGVGSSAKSQKAKSTKSSGAKADEVEDGATETVDATKADAQADEIVVEGEEVSENAEAVAQDDGADDTEAEPEADVKADDAEDAKANDDAEDAKTDDDADKADDDTEADDEDDAEKE